MITLPLMIYFIFVLIFAIYSAAGIYHLWRFGYSGDLSKAAIIIYILLSSAVILSTLMWLGFDLIQY